MGIQPAIHCTGPSSWTLRTPRPERFAILATSAFGMAKLFAQTRKFFCGLSRKVVTLSHYKWSSLCYSFYILACFWKVTKHERLNTLWNALLHRDPIPNVHWCLYVSIFWNKFRTYEDQKRFYTVKVMCGMFPFNLYAGKWFVCISGCRCIDNSRSSNEKHRNSQKF